MTVATKPRRARAAAEFREPPPKPSPCGVWGPAAAAPVSSPLKMAMNMFISSSSGSAPQRLAQSVLRDEQDLVSGTPRPFPRKQPRTQLSSALQLCV